MLLRHRRRLLTAVALAATLLALACPPAFAGPATDRLRDFFARVNAILADPGTEDQPLERVARVRRLVAELADMGAAAADALGPEWETKTAAERDEFITLFADVLERAYVGRLAGAVRVTGGLEMTYRGETLAGSDATVITALRGRGHDLRVEYRLTLRGGRWRVRDIVLDGVSIVENYRAQFKRLLGQGSYVALVAQLRDKLTEESLMFARLERRVPATVAPPQPDREVASAPPRDDAEPGAVPTPSVGERVPPVKPVTSRPPRVEPAPRRAAPAVVAVARAQVAAPFPAPVLAATVAATPVAAEPNAVAAVLGALLLGLVGMGGATALRRRASHRR